MPRAWADATTAESYFRQAAGIDEEDSRRDAASGVHIAAQGGIWQATVFGFAGLQPRSDGLALDPHLPADWQELTFSVRWRGRRVRLALRGESHTATALLESGAPLTLTVGNQPIPLQPGTTWSGTW